MILPSDPDLDDLRSIVRDLFAACRGGVEAPSEQTVKEVHLRACEQIGLAGLIEPEQIGGAGAGFSALSVVLEEAGRSLTPVPVLTSVLMGQAALRSVSESDARMRLTDGVLAGTEVLALVGLDDPDQLIATRPNGVWQLTGVHTGVLGLELATTVLVTAPIEGGLGLFAVERNDDHLAVSSMESMDITRPGHRAEFRDVNAEFVGRLTSDYRSLDHLRELRAVGLAAEQTGAAARLLEMTVDYLKTRVQFGRIIGSFQAPKHTCAELAIGLDDAKNALAHAVWAIETKGPDVDAAVALAAAVCLPMGVKMADEAVQLHGGIGFTWEHPIHLYVRRAIASQAIIGSDHRLREAVLVAENI